MVGAIQKYLLLVSVFFCGSVGIGQRNVVTNLDLLSSAVEGATEEAVQRINLRKGSTIYFLEYKDESKLTGYITDRFIKGLMDRGIKVHTVQDTVEETIVLTMNVIEASVDYTAMHRKGIWGRGEVERKAVVGLSLRVVNGQDRRVEWVGEFFKGVSDRIPVSELDSAEAGGFLLGHPVRPRDRGIRRWVEPLLVLGTVGCTAYLFYSVRSR